MGLCEISDIYKYKKLEDSDPSITSLTEAQWQMLINSTTAQIENICNRTFAATDYVSYFSGQGITSLFTDQFPINSLTSVTLVNVDETSTTEIDLDQVRIDYKLGELFRPNGWIEGDGNYKTVYNAGYTTIPDDLNLICVQEVLLQANISSKDESLKSEKLGDYSYTNSNTTEQNSNLKTKLQKYINNY